jgi:hypothetical protein
VLWIIFLACWKGDHVYVPQCNFLSTLVWVYVFVLLSKFVFRGGYRFSSVESFQSVKLINLPISYR